MVPYSPLLALSSGSLYSLDKGYEGGESHLGRLLEELSSEQDISLTKTLHFTFLAITTNRYVDSRAFRQEHGESLKPLLSTFSSLTKDIQFTISNLRLVCLPDAILLAGIPSESAFRAREELSSFLVSSPLDKEYKERYRTASHLPPRFWHTTLVRGNTQFLDGRIRELFYRFQARDFGSLTLPPPHLTLCTFDWSTRSEP